LSLLTERTKKPGFGGNECDFFEKFHQVSGKLSGVLGGKWVRAKVFGGWLGSNRFDSPPFLWGQLPIASDLGPGGRRRRRPLPTRRFSLPKLTPERGGASCRPGQKTGANRSDSAPATRRWPLTTKGELGSRPAQPPKGCGHFEACLVPWRMQIRLFSVKASERVGIEFIRV
jgi:hypothetical protein